jgi:hypothetical protein
VSACIRNDFATLPKWVEEAKPCLGQGKGLHRAFKVIPTPVQGAQIQQRRHWLSPPHDPRQNTATPKKPRRFPAQMP